MSCVVVVKALAVESWISQALEDKVAWVLSNRVFQLLQLVFIVLRKLIETILECF